MRVFIAVPLPSVVAASLERDVVVPLRGKVSGARWTPPRARHITLRFLGDCDESMVAAVCQVTVDAATAHAPFEAALGALGTFPPLGRARVLWAGLTIGAGPLTQLATGLERALNALGFEQASRPFRPHVTLARLAPPRRLVLPLEVRLVPTVFTVREVVVYRSVLLPEGARHEPLQTVILEGDRV